MTSGLAQRSQESFSRVIFAEGMDYPVKTPIPANEFDIVIPPPIEPCLGEHCIFRNGNSECGVNRHHLHSTEPTHKNHSNLAEEFRELALLTVWMHVCRHAMYHDMHEIEARIPAAEHMRLARRESRKIGKLVLNNSELRNITRILGGTKELTNRESKGLKMRREKLLSIRESLESSVEEVEVIPDELVTGALLIVAPSIARARMIEGSGVAITGTIPKSDVAIARQMAKRNEIEVMLNNRLKDPLDLAA